MNLALRLSSSSVRSKPFFCHALVGGRGRRLGVGSAVRVRVSAVRVRVTVSG